MSPPGHAPRPGRRRWLQLGASLLLPALLVVAVDRLVGWRPLLEPWQRLPATTLLPALGLLLSSYLLRAVRLQAMLGDAPGVTLGRSLRLTVEHNFLNNLLPMRAGELSFPVLAGRYCGLGLGRSVPALLLFRVLDLHSILWLGLVCLGWAAGRPGLAALGLLLLAAVAPAYLLARRLSRHLEAGESPGRLRRAAVTLLAALPERGGRFALLLGLSVANWAVKLATLAWLLAAMAGVGPVAAWLGATGGELSSVLPVHGWAGFGTYEAGITLGLAAAGARLADALPVAVNLHLVVLGTSVATGLVSIALPNRRSPSRSR